MRVSELSSCQVFPVIFLSSSAVLLHVPSGLPLFLSPGGVHFSATWGGGSSPTHAENMLLMLVRLAIATLVTLCSQRNLTIHPRHLSSKPPSLFLIFLLVLHTCTAFVLIKYWMFVSHRKMAARRGNKTRGSRIHVVWCTSR